MFGCILIMVDVIIGWKIKIFKCVILDVIDELDLLRMWDGYRMENMV